LYVIKLPNGNLRVPQSAVLSGAPDAERGRIIGQGYVEIGPDDPDYERLVGQALTEEEVAGKRSQWRAGDDDLRRQFEEWKAQRHED
jgi:hypothetical protein